VLVGNSVNNIKKSKSSMNQKLKQVGLFTILAVFSMSLTTSFGGNDEAFATQADVPSQPTEGHPKADGRDNAFGKDAKSEVSEASSDPRRPASGPTEGHPKAHQEDLKVDVLPSLKQVTINDSATRPGMDFVVTGDVTTFKVVYAVVSPANIDLRNVEILVTSDTESVNAELRGSHNGDRSIISFEIDAVDPASVSAQITGYEI